MKNATATVEHEATTSKIGEDQLFYCRQRGLSEEDAVSMIVNGFCKQVLRELPMEFAVEAQNLLGVSASKGGGLMAAPMLELVGRARDARAARRSSRASTSRPRRRGARDHGPERLGQEHARERARGPPVGTR